MSGFACVFHLDGRPAGPGRLDRLMAAAAHRGPDGSGRWVGGPVALGHLMFRTTPESAGERQPVTDETGQRRLVLDGRIDNRAELVDALHSAGSGLRDDTDAELALQAYAAWGEGFAGRLVGDFALVVWDGLRGRLVCARDPLGIKPFHYFHDGRTFLAGSELRTILADPAVPTEPDEGMVGEYLAGAVTSLEATLFRSVRRLPPGHLLVVEPGRFDLRRYWDIDPSREISHSSDAAYAGHFLDIFREAVRSRLRGLGPVGAELSGGIDSSSIVGVAHTLGKAPETFSLLFPGLPCDETAHIASVNRMWGLRSTAVSPDPADLAPYRGDARGHRDFPATPNEAAAWPLWSLAREKGFRVLLSGCGGDEWFTGNSLHYADYLRGFRLPTLVRQMRADRRLPRGAGVPAVWVPARPLLHAGLLPLVPPRLLAAGRRLLGRGEPAPGWIDARFARRIGLADRLRRPITPHRFRSFVQREMYGDLQNGAMIQGFESEERAQSALGIEVRYPFMDRRVVEFAFALPEEQRWRRERPKYVLHRAMRGLLPESVRERLDKADFSHLLPETMRAMGAERRFDSLAIEAAGWVDGTRLREDYRTMMQGYSRGEGAYRAHAWRLWMVLGVELWYRTLFAGDPAPEPEAMAATCA